MRDEAINVIAEALNFGPSTSERANLLADAQVWATLAVSAEMREQAEWFFTHRYPR